MGASFHDDVFGFACARVLLVYRVLLDRTEKMDNQLVHSFIQSLEKFRFTEITQSVIVQHLSTLFPLFFFNFNFYFLTGTGWKARPSRIFRPARS